MVLQVSTLVRNAMLDVIEAVGSGLTVTSTAMTGTPAAPTLLIFSGTKPAATTDADANASPLAILSSLTSNFMGDAASGSKPLAGTWQETNADNTGTASHFRMKTSGGTVFLQGTCGPSVSLTTNGTTAIGSNTLNFAATVPATIVAGMNITGTNVPPATTVISTTSVTVVMSNAVVGTAVATSTPCLFAYDLTIDSATITAGQQVTVTAFTLAAQNG